MLIVAELSANHNQDLNLAKESLHAIKECGADAVKLQTYTPDSLTLNCRSEIFKIKANTIWDNKYLYDLYKDAYMPLSWNEELFTLAKKLDLLCFSSAFDKIGVDLLESLNNPIYKIASFEITDIPLIKYIAKTKKPIILSSGIATQVEIKDAIEAIRGEGNYDITLLKCTSAYPAKECEMALSKMLYDAQQYNVKYGLSDHSLSHIPAIIATTLKASVIEKHFILDKKYGGVDASFSLDCIEFKELIEVVRLSLKSIGKLDYELNFNGNYEDNIQNLKGRKFARSLFICKDIKKGEVFKEEHIKSARPNVGLSPKFLEKILGKRAKRAMKYGEALKVNDIENFNA